MWLRHYRCKLSQFSISRTTLESFSLYLSTLKVLPNYKRRRCNLFKHDKKQFLGVFNVFRSTWITVGNRTMVPAATIVGMAATKKAQRNVFALYHSYNRTILLGFIWILDFHFKIVLVHCRRHLIPMRCNNGKKKNVALTMVAPFWLSALTMVARVDDDGCIISGG